MASTASASLSGDPPAAVTGALPFPYLLFLGDTVEPGYAKTAANFSLRPYGEARTLVSYEARTRASDATARRAFWRYWRVASPFVGRVMRTQLAVVEREATRSTTHGPA